MRQIVPDTLDQASVRAFLWQIELWMRSSPSRVSGVNSMAPRVQTSAQSPHCPQACGAVTAGSRSTSRVMIA
jgi:sulfur transfer protein SufE